MCIVADSVEDISKTRIASFHVAYTLDNSKTIIPAQLVVYSAIVDSLTNNNAFILPVYNPGNNHQNIIPLDMSNLVNFLDDVQNIYNRWFPKRQFLAKNSSNIENDCDTLPVHTVGDYNFSIMTSKTDFNRIDRSKLNINPAAKVSIDAHSNDYSFIVFQFYQKGNIEITPFGYLCQPIKSNMMIVPTIHGHPHENTSYLSVDFDNIAEFDHEIYTMVKSPNKTVTNFDLQDIGNLLNNITHDYMKRSIHIYCPKEFTPNKIVIKGYKNNRNLLVDSNGFKFIHDLLVDSINE